MWNATSKQLPIIVDVPLCVGGFFTLVHVGYGYYNLVATSVLPLYGPLLINASSNFYEKVRYLGYSKLVAGVSAAIFPGFGLHFLAVGFGLLHILFCSLMSTEHYRQRIM